jgi:uncharacterized OsmC-like protein
MEKTDCVIEYKRDGTNGHIFTMTDEGKPIFQVKNVELSPEGRKHWANRMLNAAALCCVCTTFASDLTKRGVEIKSLTGRSASSKEKDSVLRTHINEIEVEIEVDIGDADQSLMDECIDIVNNDTLVMYSLREGVDVQASIKRVK